MLHSKFFQFTLFLVLIFTPTYSEAELPEEAHQLVEMILSGGGYNSRLMPKRSTGEPITVTVSLLIRSLDNIDDALMSFKISTTILQEWTDEQLTFNHTEAVTLPGNNNRLWTPDLYFPDEKSSYFPQQLKPNTFLRIYPNGTVLYSTRLSITLGCSMDLSYFPLDKQVCFVRLSSYSFTQDKLKFQWRQPNSVQLLAGGIHQTAKFRLTSHSAGECSGTDASETFSGTYSCLTIKLNFQRRPTHYLTHYYSPPGMYVVIAWLSFWLGSALEARLALGVTTMLTLSSLVSSNNQNLPANTHMALDFWTGMCMNFVLSPMFIAAYLMYYKQKRIHRDDSVAKNLRTTIVPVVLNNSDLKGSGDNHLIRVDYYSRIIYPILFLVFNLVYWPVLSSEWYT